MAVSLSSSVNNVNTTGAVVTASSGDIYVFFPDTNNRVLKIWKSTNGGSSFSSLSDVTNSTIFGGQYYCTSIDAAIDSAGYIHVVCAPTDNAATRDVSYNKLNTANDTWGTWEQAAAHTKIVGNATSCNIAIDSNDKPHIAYMNVEANMGNDYSRIYYTNKTGASWATPVMVSTATTTNHFHPSVIIRNSDVVEVTYYSLAQGFYRTRTSGTWGSQGNLTGRPLHHSLSSTSGGTVYRYTFTPGATDPVYENGSSVGISTYNTDSVDSTAAALIVGSTRYIFYTTTDRLNIEYISNDGSGWSQPTTLETVSTTGLINVQIEYEYNNENQTDRINYLFTKLDSTYYLCYNYLSLVTSGSNQTISSVTSIDTAENFPSPTVSPGSVALSPDAIGSAANFPSPTVSPGAVTLSVTAIDSLEAFALSTLTIGQVNYPAQDISVGSWTTESSGSSALYSHIDEDTTDLDDYIQSPLSPSASVYELLLGSLVEPEDKNGVSVDYWIRKDQAGGQAIALSALLLCGSTEIVTWSHNDLSAEWTQMTQELTLAQAQDITNWADLRIRFSATGG